MSKNPRLKHVLEVLADKSDWSIPDREGSGKGVAIHPSKDSLVGQVAEVSVNAAGQIRVHRVICVVDCGIVVNPDTARAQLEGAIVFGLSSALNTAITVRDGRVEQSNFNNYSILRMDETPNVEVHLIDSEHSPGGVGEIGVPCIAPAVSNAVFAATGNRIHHLPMQLATATV